MSKRTIHGIDPYAPGGIEALLAHHRLTFGDAVMEGPGDPAPSGDPAPASPPAADPVPAGDPAPAADPAPAPQATDWDGKVESLPPGAQKLINELRKADGDERVAKKTLDSILKALNPDAPDDAKPDPAALASQLTTAQQ
ncbi:MAG TPA: hypothetical protein VJQ80_01270 [Arthrobacter sp.]|nr:hypothetical protein [Arthrobacter sp.]